MLAYYYDGNQRRVATQITDGAYRGSLFDPESHLIAETVQITNNPAVIGYDYIWLGDRPVAQLDSTGVHWTFADHLGTPLLQTNSTAGVTWRAEYEPYGEVWALRGGDVHQPLRLPGQSSEQFDTGANGLTERSYNSARWYRPAWGRYSQADPDGIANDTSLYRYAADNPIIVDDPSGLGGPYHAPLGVQTRCTKMDDCPTLRAKIWVLGRMISSHMGWDWNVPSPNGGARHKKEIADFWNAIANCLNLYFIKCTGRKDCPLQFPEKAPFSQPLNKALQRFYCDPSGMLPCGGDYPIPRGWPDPVVVPG